MPSKHVIAVSGQPSASEPMFEFDPTKTVRFLPCFGNEDCVPMAEGAAAGRPFRR